MKDFLGDENPWLVFGVLMVVAASAVHQLFTRWPDVVEWMLARQVLTATDVVLTIHPPASAGLDWARILVATGALTICSCIPWLIGVLLRSQLKGTAK